MTPFDWPRCPVCCTEVLPSERGVARWVWIDGRGLWLVTVHEVCDGRDA